MVLAVFATRVFLLGSAILFLFKWGKDTIFSVNPNAKINLGLNIIEKRPDGYHNLETIFYPIHLQDALEVTRRENNDAPYTLHVKGTAIEGKPEDNLVIAEKGS